MFCLTFFWKVEYDMISYAITAQEVLLESVNKLQTDKKSDFFRRKLMLSAFGYFWVGCDETCQTIKLCMEWYLLLPK